MLRIERLEADQQALPAARFDQLQELFIVRGVDAGLADPADLQRNQRAEEFLRLIHVRGDVVIHEEDQRFLHAADLFDDLFDGPPRLRVGEVSLNRAELAAEVTSTSGFDQTNREISLAGEDRAIGTKS